jgi:hypothetical protein
MFPYNGTETNKYLAILNIVFNRLMYKCVSKPSGYSLCRKVLVEQARVQNKCYQPVHMIQGYETAISYFILNILKHKP